MDWTLIQIGPPAEFRREQLIARWIEADSGNHFVLMLQTHRHTKHRKSVGEVRSAIERVNVPAIVASRISEAFLFTQNVVSGKLRADPLADQGLRLAIGNCDQISFALIFNLDLLIEVLHEQSAGLASNCGDTRDIFEIRYCGMQAVSVSQMGRRKAKTRRLTIAGSPSTPTVL